VVKRSLEASCTHDMCVTGATDQELDSLRSSAFNATEPRVGGMSKTMSPALMGGRDFDPIHRCSRDLVVALHRALWEGWLPEQVLQAGFAAELARAQSAERWQSSKALERAGLPQGALPFRQLRRWTSVGKGSAADAMRWPPLADKEKGYARCGAAPGTLRHRHVERSDGWEGLDLPAAMAGLKARGDSDAARALAGTLPLAEPQHRWAPSCGALVDGSAFDAEAADLTAAGCAVIALPPGPE
ncbi:unnamed protein product, partial [Prorocentrum cordatum]